MTPTHTRGHLSAERGEGLVYMRLITGWDVLRVVHTHVYMLGLNGSDMACYIRNVMDSELHCKIELVELVYLETLQDYCT